MAIAITEAECDQVRKAIDIRLDAVTLPNETILLDIYGPFAVRKVTNRFAEDTVPEDYEADALTAAILTCAALLIPAIKQIKTEKIAGHEKSFEVYNWDKKKADLEARAGEIITGILGIIAGDPDTAGMPPFFLTVSANRHNRRW